MKKYAGMLALTLAYTLLLSYQTTVKAADDVLMTEKCELGQTGFSIYFSKTEKTGMISQFAISGDGRIATEIKPVEVNINVYEKYGYYDFTIYTNITRSDTILHWEDDALFIYLHSSNISDESYRLIKVNGYEDYEFFQCPVNESTREFWSRLEKNQDEFITDKGRYYVQYGNLRYTDNESGEDCALTENTSFRPWWLLSIPILTAIIWFGFLRKRVKEWEKEQNNRLNNKDC